MGPRPGLRPTQGYEKRRQPLPTDQPPSPCHPDRSEAQWRDPRFFPALADVFRERSHGPYGPPNVMKNGSDQGPWLCNQGMAFSHAAQGRKGTLFFEGYGLHRLRKNCFLFIEPPPSRLSHEPCPLDGCPMFATSAYMG